MRRYDILDTPPDGAFDRITAIAARRFGVPISIISIVDHDRIWFKSHHGLDIAQIGRDPGLCASAILVDNPWILDDARTDIRSLANPLVAGEFGLRFYIGVPLKTHDGFNLGTLCVIDTEPHKPDLDKIEDLKDLAQVVMDQMELRLAARRALAATKIVQSEIDHRVMTSLQSVALTLNMQAAEAVEPGVIDALETAAGRVAAVAGIHQHFYLDEEADRAEAMTYIRDLCTDLAPMLGGRIRVGGTDAVLRSSQMPPLGLIIHELVTNAVRHGGGSVDVRFEPRDGEHVLTVSDEGPGLPAGFTFEDQRPGIGMILIDALVDQLGGGWKFGANANGAGARFEISFPVDQPFAAD